MYNFKPVDSSRMSNVGWENNCMYIEFPDGHIYEYSNTTKQQYLDFLKATSLGHELETFQQNHPYKKIK